jgi:hypothetical protein
VVAWTNNGGGGGGGESNNGDFARFRNTANAGARSP